MLDQASGLVESFIGMFSPYMAMSRDLQAMFQLQRPPACRADHGRLEILLRGVGMTDEPLEQRVSLARRLTEAARPLLRAHSKHKHRRFAERAIAVVFEDEQVVGEGIATSRFSYLASHDYEITPRGAGH